MLTLPRIESLFASHGTACYGGEAISQTAHALQCAQLAEQAGEPEPLIVAALLHDVGHLMLAESSTTDMRHQEAAADALAEVFGEAVTEPIRLHVAAKRYLCTVDAGYFATLSPASVHSLALQGGPYDAAQAATFAADPPPSTLMCAGVSLPCASGPEMRVTTSTMRSPRTTSVMRLRRRSARRARRCA